MDDVMDLLKFAFDYAEEVRQQPPPVTFTLADDLEGQKRDVQHLVALAHFAKVPQVLREFAYDTLRDLARHYRSANPVDVPVEIYIWSLGVAAGDLQPPIPPRGRDGSKNIFRNHAIGEMVAWQRCEFGDTREVAVARVAEVLDLTSEAIETILRNLSKKKQIAPIC